jgi:hypothetical protein
VARDNWLDLQILLQVLVHGCMRLPKTGSVTRSSAVLFRRESGADTIGVPSRQGSSEPTIISARIHSEQCKRKAMHEMRSTAVGALRTLLRAVKSSVRCFAFTVG